VKAIAPFSLKRGVGPSGLKASPRGCGILKITPLGRASLQWLKHFQEGVGEGHSPFEFTKRGVGPSGLEASPWGCGILKITPLGRASLQWLKHFQEGVSEGHSPFEFTKERS